MSEPQNPYRASSGVSDEQAPIEYRRGWHRPLRMTLLVLGVCYIAMCCGIVWSVMTDTLVRRGYVVHAVDLAIITMGLAITCYAYRRVAQGGTLYVLFLAACSLVGLVPILVSNMIYQVVKLLA